MSIIRKNKEYLAINEMQVLFMKNKISISMPTIRKYIRQEKFGAKYKEGKYIYFPKEEVDKYIYNFYVNRINSKAQVLVFANHKGGVGKTLSALNIAVAFGLRKHKVLCVDVDPQANLTLGFDISEPRLSLFDLLINKVDIKRIIMQTPNSNVDIIPSSSMVGTLERRPNDFSYTEDDLRQALIKIESDYDFIIVDTPPQFTLLTSNAVRAATYLFIPVLGDYDSLIGLNNFLDYANEDNPNLLFTGLFLTRYHKQRVLDNQVLNILEDDYKDVMLDTKIRENAALREAKTLNKDVFSYQFHSHGAIDYRKLSDEILEILKEFNNEE